MRRFWKEVSVEAADGGCGIRLDGRPVRTPARAELNVPSEALAESALVDTRLAAKVNIPEEAL